VPLLTTSEVVIYLLYSSVHIVECCNTGLQ